MSKILFHPSRLVSELKLHASASSSDRGDGGPERLHDDHTQPRNRTAELAQGHAEIDLTPTPFDRGGPRRTPRHPEQHHADLTEHYEHQRND